MPLSASLILAIGANANVPPPVEGDDRTAILATVNALFERLDTADGEAFREVLVPEGTIFIHNEMNPDDPQFIVRSNAIMTDREGPHEHVLTQKRRHTDRAPARIWRMYGRPMRSGWTARRATAAWTRSRCRAPMGGGASPT